MRSPLPAKVEEVGKVTPIPADLLKRLRAYKAPVALAQQEVGVRGYIRHDDSGFTVVTGYTQRRQKAGLPIPAVPDTVDQLLESLTVIDNPNLDVEARSNEYGTGDQPPHIAVGPKFHRLTKALQEHVLLHEAAHFYGMDDEYLNAKGADWNLADRLPHRSLNGQTTPGEIIAEAYAVYAQEGRAELEQWAPGLADIIERLANEVGLPLPDEHEVKKTKEPPPLLARLENNFTPRSPKTSTKTGMTYGQYTKSGMRVRAQSIVSRFTKDFGLGRIETVIEGDPQKWYEVWVNDRDPSIQHGPDDMVPDAFAYGGRIFLGPGVVRDLSEPKGGLTAAHMIAHELAHTMSGIGSWNMGLSSLVEEGAAEVLATVWTARRMSPEFLNAPFNVRSMPGDPAFRGHTFGTDAITSDGVYRARVLEVLGTAIRHAGWDRDAVLREVEQAMRGTHEKREEWFRGDPNGFPTGGGTDVVRFRVGAATGQKYDPETKTFSAVGRADDPAFTELVRQATEHGIDPTPYMHSPEEMTKFGYKPDEIEPERKIDGWSRALLKWLADGTPKAYEPGDPDTFEQWYADWAQGLSDPQREALLDYAVSDFRWVNGVLRGRVQQAVDHWNEGEGYEDMTVADAQAAADRLIPLMDSALEGAEVPQDVLVYRGVKPGLQAGDVFEDKGFVSTSVGRKRAEDFTLMYDENNPGLVAEVRVPQGTRGAYLDAAFGDRGQHEKELLLGRGLRFRVVSVEPLVLEVVP